MNTSSRITKMQQKFEDQHAGKLDFTKGGDDPRHSQYLVPATQEAWDAYYVKTIGEQEDRAAEQDTTKTLK